MFSARYRYLYIALLGAYSFFNIKFTEGDQIFDFTLNSWLLLLFISVFVFSLWEGNRLLSKFSARFRFGKAEYTELIAHFLLSFFMVTIISVAGYYLISTVISYPKESATFRLMLGFNFRINLFLHCVNAIIFYKNRVSKYQVEAERFDKERAEAQFEALRNQVNPHFLFNSLNVLSGLINSKPKEASAFTQKLSDVYRYILKNKGNKLVKLEEEIQFLEDYLFLMSIRFQENIKVQNNISEKSKLKFIPPSALQLLVENAIKHNEVSKKSPLFISVYNQNGHLVVENNIQLKEQKVESSHTGLSNIRQRYSFLSDDNPVIVHANGKFTVKLPLIEIENERHSN